MHQRADRYIESSELGLDLYRGVAELPIVSPHGHIGVGLLADPAARLDPPVRLFVTADHYVVRMLYSQGVPLERAGLRTRDAERAEVDDRAVWQVLADNVHLFALTPTVWGAQIRFRLQIHEFADRSRVNAPHTPALASPARPPHVWRGAVADAAQVA